MKKYTLAIIFSFISILSQSNNYETIKVDPQYLWGEGWGVTLADAERQAMENIASQIVINISNTTQLSSSDEAININSKVNTYTQSSLTNTSRIIVENEPDAHVMIYIKKDEIQKMFDNRLKRAFFMIDEGEKALEKLKIDNALRNFYWAYSLVRSLQYPSQAKYQDKVLVSWLPQKIKDILSNINVYQTSRKGQDINIQILYNNQAINSLDYTFFDGSNWSNIYSAANGTGIIELRPSAETNNLKIKCEYEYRAEAHIDAEIQSVMTIISPTIFKEAYRNISTEEVKVKTQEKEQSFSNITKTREYSDIISELVEYIETKNYDNAKPLFTDAGFSIYTQLLKYGNAKIVGKDQLSFLQFNNEVQCRGVLAHFNFRNNQKKFIEELTFHFDKDSLISNISFGLGNTAKNDILNKGVWSETSRIILINFLETYKTAFALKRLDYIQKVFDDDAVIIIGQEVYKPQVAEQKNYLNNKAVKYTRKNKEEYVSHLKYQFSRNEYINIRFANNDVIKLGGMGGEVYGIQIKQDYFSSTYGDTGYLFLLVDLNDPEQPIIKVRTWQPHRDEEFGKNGLIGAEDF